jgi:glycosyltransferase involved in cell wall biosynthesis
MAIQKLIYITNARLPTEKAHGFQICKMCEALARNGVEVSLLHPYRYQWDPGLQGRNVFDYYSVPRSFQVRTLPNLDVVPLERFLPKGPFPAVFFAHAFVWGLYGALIARREKADLYYTRDSELAYWLGRLGMPTVYEAHLVPKVGQWLLLRRLACQPALRLVVVLTWFIKEQFAGMGFPEERVIELPDGVDLALFEDLPSKEECRRRLGLPLDSVIIGYIGRFQTLEMEKGIPELVQAMALLPTVNGSEPLLLCVGGPMDAVPSYFTFASQRGVPEHRLKFVDRVPNREVPHWIRACDVVTIPWPWTEFSAYFTSPLKLFEYMAAGVPIVATDLPSLREVLRHGENAWLVEPGSSRSLGEGLKIVLGDWSTAQRLAAQARSDVHCFTWVERAHVILAQVAKAHGYR